jgi:hypothetical protein
MWFRAGDLRPHGWVPPQTLHIPDWCGGTTEYQNAQPWVRFGPEDVVFAQQPSLDAMPRFKSA